MVWPVNKGVNVKPNRIEGCDIGPKTAVVVKMEALVEVVVILRLNVYNAAIFLLVKMPVRSLNIWFSRESSFGGPASKKLAARRGPTPSVPLA